MEGSGRRQWDVELRKGRLFLPLSNINESEETLLHDSIRTVFGKNKAKTVWRQFQEAQDSEYVAAREFFYAPYVAHETYCLTMVDEVWE